MSNPLLRPVHLLLTVVLATLLALTTTAVTAPPAHAGTVGTITVIAPDYGTVFARGSEVEVAAVVDEFEIGSTVTWETWGYWGYLAGGSGSTTTTDIRESVVIPVPSKSDTGTLTVQISVEDAGTGQTESVRTKVVIGAITGSGAQPSTFYPLVRDGFRDTTSVHYKLTGRTTNTRVRILDGDRTVALLSSRAQDRGTYSVRWDGRNKSGELVRPGRYRAEIRTRWWGSGSESLRFVPIEVATRTVTRRGSTSLGGRQTSSRRTRGSCYINPSSYPAGVQLDCWGGIYAQVTYDVRVPADADRVSWSVRGDVGCCDEGQIQRSARRVRPGLVRVTVKVTNWRAFTVNRVTVGWARSVQQ